jgi:4'-phosphopantetheinyl transferase
VESSFLDVAPGGIESTRFGRREVQIWRVWLNTTESALGFYRAALCLEERNRAERFRFENLKRSYVACRGGLRVLLGHYLGCSPRDIQLICGQKGKPALRGMSSLRFNVSHSGDLALFAFTLDCELGVDVERLRELDDLESIASRFFCAAEASELLSLSPGDRRTAFFRCWTRKEAYVKAVGDGLSIPLDRFQVTLLPGDPCRFVHIANDAQTALQWTLHDLELAPEYIGALAYQDSPRPTTLRPAVGAEQLPAIVGSDEGG